MSGVPYTLVQVIEVVLNLIQLLIFLSFLISWFGADPHNPLVNMIRSLTEPMYTPIRRHITGRFSSSLDLSPIVILLVVISIQKVIQFQILSALR